MTDEIFYEGELNRKRIATYKKLADNYRVQEGTVRDIFSQGISFACTHTQAHTEGLRGRVKELEEAMVVMKDYWNQERNDEAMNGALWFIIDTIDDLLEKKL